MLTYRASYPRGLGTLVPGQEPVREEAALAQLRDRDIQGPGPPFDERRRELQCAGEGRRLLRAPGLRDLPRWG